MMSVLCKTDLTEYARQCTLQRRRYEECLQEAHQSGTTQVTEGSTDAATQTVVEALTETYNLEDEDQCTPQGCLIDLLELSVRPLAWDDKQSILQIANDRTTETRQWYDDRSQSTQQQMASSMRKSANPVSYGAP